MGFYQRLLEGYSRLGDKVTYQKKKKKKRLGDKVE